VSDRIRDLIQRVTQGGIANQRFAEKVEPTRPCGERDLRRDGRIADSLADDDALRARSGVGDARLMSRDALAHIKNRRMNDDVDMVMFIPSSPSFASSEGV
jgi:hypothetical protein